MRKIVLLGLVLTGALFAANEQSRTFNIEGTADLSLSNISGSITISRGSADSIQVSYEKSSDEITVKMEQNGDKVTVSTEYPQGFHGRGGVDFTVLFPPQGRLDIESVSGTIKLADVSGKIGLQTVSGNLHLERSGGEMELNAVSGSIELSEIGSASMEANSISGSITYKGGSLEGGDYQFNSTSGRIHISHGSDASYKIEGRTVSGAIDSRVGDGVSVKKAKYGPLKSVSGDFNGGEVNLEVNTVSGSITIEQD